MEFQEGEMNMNVNNIIMNGAGQTFTRRVGKTTFRVRVFHSENASETMEEKILRIIRNSEFADGEECGIMEVPQMSRQSERSA